MKGRVLNIKKTTLLRLSFILNLILYLSLTAVSFVFLGESNNYFFLFCFLVGIHLIIKGMLFRLDSSCYFGNILLFIGVTYFYSLWMNILVVYPVFILCAFAFASLVCVCFFSQPVHLYLAVFCLFVSVVLLLYLFKIISLPLFLAILVGSVLLLLVRILTLK